MNFKETVLSLNVPFYRSIAFVDPGRNTFSIEIHHKVAATAIIRPGETPSLIFIVIIEPAKSASLIIIVIERCNGIRILFQDGPVLYDGFTGLLDRMSCTCQYESLAWFNNAMGSLLAKLGRLTCNSWRQVSSYLRILVLTSALLEYFLICSLRLASFCCLDSGARPIRNGSIGTMHAAGVPAGFN